MWQKIKDFYYKRNFDHSAALLDPFEYHLTFYKLIVMFRVADVTDTTKNPWMNQNTVIAIIGALAATQVFLAMCHGIYNRDLMEITEGGTYFIVMVYLLLIQLSTKLNVEQYRSLQSAMKADFKYICTEGARYRKRYFKVQLTTWKICILIFIFTAMVGIGIVIFTCAMLFIYLATHKPDDPEPRPLLFPYWQPGVDFSETPYYEIAFHFGNLCSVVYAYNYIFMLQTQVAWIRHIGAKVDIIVWSIEDLLENIHPATCEQESRFFAKVIIKRMRRILMHHQEMLGVLGDYAIVYKKMLMFEQKLCGPVVCLTAYCTVTKLERDGIFQPVLAYLSFGTSVVHFIPSYFCTFLADKVRSVSDACWNIPFWNAGRVIRPYMILLMQRAMRPLPLGAPGFESISVETYSKEMTSAYSMFNMLRQTDL